jgi:hypothetical protein
MASLGIQVLLFSTDFSFSTLSWPAGFLLPHLLGMLYVSHPLLLQASLALMFGSLIVTFLQNFSLSYIWLKISVLPAPTGWHLSPD